ncbi:MAG: NADH:ubiquinone reductase (Na(+)-transporting) subunit D [Simkaniaceae bacterium]
MSSEKPLKRYFLEQILENNQILVAVLGICSALAVTIKVDVAITMGLSVIFVTGFSCFFVSLIRNQTPDSVRMIAQLAIISLFVITVDQFLKAFFYEMSITLSVFVGLIITNCLVMGRCESLARHVRPLAAFMDGAGAGTGYALVLLVVGIIREFLGFGTLLGFRLIPNSFYADSTHPDAYLNNNLMALAPSAFFILGFLIWISNYLSNRDEL